MNLNLARRGFLRHSIAIVPTAALAATTVGCTTDSAHTEGAAPAAGAALLQQPTAPYQPTFFHPDEWSFIRSAVARLIPSDDSGPGALEAGVPEFIDRQMDAVFGHAAIWYMQGPFVDSPPEFGYQGRLAPREVYRVGIAALDAHCKLSYTGRPFAQLDAAQQDAVLKTLESGDIKFDSLSATTFFGFLLQNTKEGYLSDPIHGGNKNTASWAMIGFPGARADYADWVGRPGERYPLPPVSINGPQATGQAS
ncbi:MAG: gluconate 2-dehydrogenase subunit 3 family protein [Rhodoferax sp.]|nr:gluconate 2-dehydrogenase subunit 3 family protein [Rhodoferax sp.]